MRAAAPSRPSGTRDSAPGTRHPGSAGSAGGGSAAKSPESPRAPPADTWAGPADRHPRDTQSPERIPSRVTREPALAATRPCLQQRPLSLPAVPAALMAFQGLPRPHHHQPADGVPDPSPHRYVTTRISDLQLPNGRIPVLTYRRAAAHRRGCAPAAAAVSTHPPLQSRPATPSRHSSVHASLCVRHLPAPAGPEPALSRAFLPESLSGPSPVLPRPPISRVPRPGPCGRRTCPSCRWGYA